MRDLECSPNYLKWYSLNIESVCESIREYFRKDREAWTINKGQEMYIFLYFCIAYGIPKYTKLTWWICCHDVHEIGERSGELELVGLLEYMEETIVSFRLGLLRSHTPQSIVLNIHFNCFKVKMIYFNYRWMCCLYAFKDEH